MCEERERNSFEWFEVAVMCFPDTNFEHETLANYVAQIDNEVNAHYIAVSDADKLHIVKRQARNYYKFPEEKRAQIGSIQNFIYKQVGVDSADSNSLAPWRKFCNLPEPVQDAWIALFDSAKEFREKPENKDWKPQKRGDRDWTGPRTINAVNLPYFSLTPAQQIEIATNLLSGDWDDAMAKEKSDSYKAVRYVCKGAIYVANSVARQNHFKDWNVLPFNKPEQVEQSWNWLCEHYPRFNEGLVDKWCEDSEFKGQGNKFKSMNTAFFPPAFTSDVRRCMAAPNPEPVASQETTANQKTWKAYGLHWTVVHGGVETIRQLVNEFEDAVVELIEMDLPWDDSDVQTYGPTHAATTSSQ